MKKEESQLPTTDYVDNEIIQKCIYNIRGQQVMIDSDVASFFNTTTSLLNRQMKRNIE